MWWRLRTLAGLCCGRQVGLDGCLFALRLTDREALPLVSRRLGALEAFYAPLGEPEVRTRWIDASRVLVGAIDVGRRERPDDELLVWGGPLPAHLSDARSLLDASDRDLRALDGVVAAFA